MQKGNGRRLPDGEEAAPAWGVPVFVRGSALTRLGWNQGLTVRGFVGGDAWQRGGIRSAERLAGGGLGRDSMKDLWAPGPEMGFFRHA